MNKLQTNLQVTTCCNVRLIYYPGTSILNPLHTPKKTIVRWNHRLLYMHSIIMPNRLKKMLRIGGRRHATGAIPMVQRVVKRVLSFHRLFAGKSKWKIHVGNKLRDMHHLYMGLWRFLYNENFHYFPRGALEVCPWG